MAILFISPGGWHGRSGDRHQGFWGLFAGRKELLPPYKEVLPGRSGAVPALHGKSRDRVFSHGFSKMHFQIYHTEKVKEEVISSCHVCIGL